MKNVNEITVFLASPGDVELERQIVEETIEELNQTWGKPNNYRIRLESWEKSSYPSMGEDAQEALNRQLDFNFDLFVCIFWKRVGTETKRAESGSIEELEAALKKYNNGETIDIMAYFKDEPIPPSEFTDQVLKVNNLRERFRSLGLYHTFSSSEQFKKIFRLSFTNCLNNRFLIEKKNSRTTNIENSLEKEYKDKLEIINKISNIKIDETDIQDGVFEIYELLNDKSERLTFILDDLSSTINLMSENLTRRVEDLNNVTQISDNRLKIKKANIVINRSAEDMQDVSNKLENEFESFKDSFIDVTNSFVLVYEELKYDENAEETKVLKSLINSMEGAINGLGAMFLAVHDLPKMNSKLGIAKVKLMKNLKMYINELKFGHDLLSEVEKKIR